jgi:hypothetical protein
VRLVPESGPSLWSINGRTNVEGVATLWTHAKFFGVPAGTFKVLVSKTGMTPSKYTPPPAEAPPEEIQEYTKLTSIELRETIRYIEPKYNQVDTTPHSITITKGKNQQTFDVGAPVEIIGK